MTIGRRALVAGSAALGLGAVALAGYRVLQGPPPVVSSEPGLVGLWGFDEGDGEAVRDASGHGNNGILVAPAGPTWGSDEFDGSVSLGGPDRSFVSVPASKSLNTLTTALTVTAHAYPRELRLAGPRYDGHIVLVQRQWRRVIHPDLFYLGYGPLDGELAYKWHVGLTDDVPSIYRRTETRAPTVGQWVHLAGVYDGTSGEMSLYAEGELLESQTHKGQIRLDSESLERPVMIGAELNSGSLSKVSGAFNGYVEEVRIYDRALGASEIATLADSAKSRRSGGS